MALLKEDESLKKHKRCTEAKLKYKKIFNIETQALVQNSDKILSLGEN